MACLLFLWARAAFDTNFQYDLPIFCLLLALEGPQYARILVYLWKNR